MPLTGVIWPYSEKTATRSKAPVACSVNLVLLGCARRKSAYMNDHGKTLLWSLPARAAEVGKRYGEQM